MSSSSKLHARNPHSGQYDFVQLVAALPELESHVFVNRYQNKTIDFSDAKSVIALNKALLKAFYHIDFWDLPPTYLCPPIPGRADYIHCVADLLALSNNGNIPTGKSVTGLDVGTGANLIYPIIGSQAYGWQFKASDIDPVSVNCGKQIVKANKVLTKNIDVNLQSNAQHIYHSVIQPDDRFDFTMCNPPFHHSMDEASKGADRKRNNLAKNRDKRGGTAQSNAAANAKLNFGGQNAELWCEGGEPRFVEMMIEQSCQYREQCLWFSTLVSKKDNLKAIYAQLKTVKAKRVETIEMRQGQKVSRLVAWTFLTKPQHQQWASKNWG